MSDGRRDTDEQFRTMLRVTVQLTKLSRVEALEWYLWLNSGGTPHSPEALAVHQGSPMSTNIENDLRTLRELVTNGPLVLIDVDAHPLVEAGYIEFAYSRRWTGRFYRATSAGIELVVGLTETTTE